MSIEQDILKTSRVIAVVGISPKPGRPSRIVAEYLRDAGYRVIGVNPMFEEALGEVCYPDLLSVPEAVDIVDIFRRPEAVPPVVEEAIKIGAKVVWMQEGIVNESAAARARDAGLAVVMDRCTLKEHRKMGQS